MKRLSLTLIFIQLILIAFAKILNYYFQHFGGRRWLNIGELVMKYQTVFMLIIIASFFIEIFTKEKLIVKLTVIALTVITFIIWGNLWLYPW